MPKGEVDPTTLPAELVEQVARGNCVLLLGPAADGQGLQPFVQVLAAECDYPAEKTDRSLPAVARYYQALMGGRQVGRQRLVARLREWLERNGTELTLLHQALARLPLKRIVDFSYDGRLAKALRQAADYRDVDQDTRALPV